MSLLLDTRAFLWFVLNDPRLTTAALEAVTADDNRILVSPASYWEIAIKISIGKYQLDEPYQDFFEGQLQSNGFRILPIEPRILRPSCPSLTTTAILSTA